MLTTVPETVTPTLDGQSLSRWLDDGGRERPDDFPHESGGLSSLELTPTACPVHPIPLSALHLTPTNPLDAERTANEGFVRTYSAPEFRGRLTRLYDRWREINATYFENRLATPHISIGLTAPRRFSETRLRTDYGGAINLVLSARVVFGTDTRVVRAEFPAEGFIRFEDDLLLAATVKQFVLEVLGTDEEGYGGYGARFAAEATRIGQLLGLPTVETRRRAYRGMGQPVAAFWPWAFRPEGYYLGHIRLDHLQVAGLRPNRRAERYAAVPGIYEYFLFLLVTEQTVRLTDILGRVVDAEREARSPAVAAFERRPHDASGVPLPLPPIDPAWLTWNGGCVRAIAEGIRTRRAFDGMPILADALQDAGCENDLILSHCRAHAVHTANCFVLRLLTEPTET
jgi:hypothetical protein